MNKRGPWPFTDPEPETEPKEYLQEPDARDELITKLRQALECIAVGDYKNERQGACDVLIETGIWLKEAEPVSKARGSFLDLALSCGANLTGAPDGSCPVTVVFTVDAWRKFDSAVGCTFVADPKEQE